MNHNEKMKAWRAIERLDRILSFNYGEAKCAYPRMPAQGRSCSVIHQAVDAKTHWVLRVPASVGGAPGLAEFMVLEKLASDLGGRAVSPGHDDDGSPVLLMPKEGGGRFEEAMRSLLKSGMRAVDAKAIVIQRLPKDFRGRIPDANRRGLSGRLSEAIAKFEAAAEEHAGAQAIYRREAEASFPIDAVSSGFVTASGAYASVRGLAPKVLVGAMFGAGLMHLAKRS